MSRIAEAAARAGRAVGEAEARAWERERDAARQFFAAAPAKMPQPAPPAPNPPPPQLAIASPQKRRVDASASETVDFELTAAMRRIFLSANVKPVRSLLFCTAPGEAVNDVAWQAAERLAPLSGSRIAFVEDASHSVASRGKAHPLITRLGWYANAADERPKTSPSATASQPSADPAADNDVLGGRVSDLFRAFDFVILNATASTADELVPLAQDVDGVIVLVTEGLTRREAATNLVATLREGRANLLGVVLTNKK